MATCEEKKMEMKEAQEAQKEVRKTPRRSPSANLGPAIKVLAKDGKSFEITDLDETVTREEVVVALCIARGKLDLEDPCRLYKSFGGVQTALVRRTFH